MVRSTPRAAPQTMDAAAFHAARIPIRAPAVGTTDHGRRALGRAGGIGTRAEKDQVLSGCAVTKDLTARDDSLSSPPHVAGSMARRHLRLFVAALARPSARRQSRRRATGGRRERAARCALCPTPEIRKLPPSGTTPHACRLGPAFR